MPADDLAIQSTAGTQDAVHLHFRADSDHVHRRVRVQNRECSRFLRLSAPSWRFFRRRGSSLLQRLNGAGQTKLCCQFDRASVPSCSHWLIPKEYTGLCSEKWGVPWTSLQRIDDPWLIYAFETVRVERKDWIGGTWRGRLQPWVHGQCRAAETWNVLDHLERWNQ